MTSDYYELQAGDVTIRRPASPDGWDLVAAEASRLKGPVTIHLCRCVYYKAAGDDAGTQGADNEHH